MDSVHEALAVVAAEAERSRLAPSATIRVRGDRIKRRRTIAGAQVVLVGAVVLVAAVAWRGSPQAVQPPITRPSPSITPTIEPSPSIPPTVQEFRGGCGHGGACPDGNGPFRVVIESSRSTYPSVDVSPPAGWKLDESSSEGIRFLAPSYSAGVALLWPVHLAGGDGNARALAQSVASMPGSSAPTPERVTIDGHPAWRVSIHQSQPESTECVDPRLGLYPGEAFVHGDLAPNGLCSVLFDLGSATGERPLRTPVGLSGLGEVQVTFVDGVGPPGATPGDILAIVRWAAVGESPDQGQTVVDGLRFGRVDS